VTAAFIYCRKSTDDEDRQVLSISAQTESLAPLAEQRNITNVEVLSESRTAKVPGRPVFEAMMRRIERGERKLLFCWTIDRLARNPVDAGRVMWALKEHGLEIVTPTRTFKPGDELTLVLYLEFAMAQKYSEDLGRNVKRGLEKKAAMGWRPTLAPVGYRNNIAKRQGERDVSPDPDRFHLVRKMWDLMLTGCHTPPQILKLATNKWGLRMRGGTPLALSGIYRLFTDPYYYGQFEYPRGSGRWYRGSHQSMITIEEYDRVQVLLGRKGQPRPVTHFFPFRGLITCGMCRAAVTAEVKHQLICSDCRLKFAYRNRQSCPRCDTPIDHMKAPVVLKYVYYHCTRKKNPHCREPVIRLESLEAQINATVARFHLSKPAFRWGMKYLQELKTKRQTDTAEVRTAQQKAYDDCCKRLRNLLTLKTSPENIDGFLLSDDEYAAQRRTLLKEKAKLEAVKAGTGDPVAKAVQQVSDTLSFLCRLRERLADGSPQLKHALVARIGSNLTLRAKKLDLEPLIPFRIVDEEIGQQPNDSAPIEPDSGLMKSGGSAAFRPALLIVCTPRDDVRTYQQRVHRLVRRLFAFFTEHPECVISFSEPDDEEAEPTASRRAA
jgi:site-specific DNA recombinase